MKSAFQRITCLEVIFTLMVSSLFHSTILSSYSAPAIARYRYSCNFTFVVQGDISDLRGVNQAMVFPNATRQSVFIEEAKGIVDNVEYKGSLVLDEQGNAILAFDFPLDIVRSQSVVTLYVRVTIIQRASDSSVSIDELKRALLSEVPLSLVERYAGNSTAWPISSTIQSLALNLRRGCGETCYDLLSTFSKWIEEHVAYPLKHGVRELIGPQYPDETYESGVGDCDDRSILFTTMCRAVGIPSFIQVGGIPRPSYQYEEDLYNGNYVYKSKGIAWHAWSVVYVPRVGWIPVDTTYFSGAVVEEASGGLCYIKSPEGLDPKITSSAYFIASPIIYANYATLKYVEEARAWERAVKEGRVKVVCVEELEVLYIKVPIPIELPLILSLAFVVALLLIYFRLKRREGLLKKT